MACACGQSYYNGRCGCHSNYEGMRNHLTDQQMKNIRRKFEDKLFAQAYYADDDTYSQLFGIGKKKKEAKQTGTTETAPKKKLNLGAIADKGVNLLQKVGGLLGGQQPVYSGDYEGVQYEANVNANRESENKKPEEKKGIPKPVIITGIVVILILLLFIGYKMMSNRTAAA